jgi:hypothetical protein
MDSEYRMASVTVCDPATDVTQLRCGRKKGDTVYQFGDGSVLRAHSGRARKAGG